MKNKNKLRNTFLAASFCLLNTISYGQTKEETISWLKEKLSKYIIYHSSPSDGSIKLESIDECEFVIYYSCMDISSRYSLRSSFPTEGINFNEEGKIFYNNTVIGTEYRNNAVIIYDKTTDKILLEDREEKIRERVKKALDHLATFCPKKKETF